MRKIRMLFVGLGSAGQRHLRNILRLYKDEVKISAYRTSNRQDVYNDSLEIVPGKRLDDIYPMEIFRDYGEALSAGQDIVWITNPNLMHIQMAIDAAKGGAALFIEKPLSVNMKGIDELQAIVRKEKNFVYIGFQNRFNPAIKDIKRIVSQGTYGRVIDVYVEVGELVTSMHRYQDYRTMVETRSDMGGGVIMCQIHEIDYLYYLFGMPKEIYSVGGQYSSLEMDVEDTATTLMRYHYGVGEFPVVLHQDYSQFPPRRKGRIVFEKGRVEFDLLLPQVRVDAGDLHKVITYHEFQRNNMFLEEDRRFVEDWREHRKSFVSLEEGIASLKIGLAIKESMRKHQIVSLEGYHGKGVFGQCFD